ncbi:hypothetical protein [Paenibacillus sp. MMS20-IR301]|uniref:hypothetical protein n=1 Tax=Paenibacillus sp. MMS20-IR301 TaxID=2895946 RepID=UPI0028EC5577|nr:hypothetical protein [Paenibacillus sp. MMS20-IR301]WNS43303.1 hypothetical protein LOS79_30930 [Paenibacillus sp. MMS20-IR301]
MAMGDNVSIQGPTANLYANFGAAFVASLNNVNTNSYYSGYTATFVASYQLKASLSVPFPGGTNGVVTYDFGSYTDSFNAYPSAMQH